MFSGSALPMSRIPSGFGQLFWTKHVYGFTTEPQVHAKGQQRFFPRGASSAACDYSEMTQIILQPSFSAAALRSMRRWRSTARRGTLTNGPSLQATTHGRGRTSNGE
jgi:hypothetical protein